MTLSITPNQTQIYTALRYFLINLPLLFNSANQGSVEVIRGQINRVPEPHSPDFVSMIFIHIERLETNIDQLQMTGTVGSNSYMQPSKVTVQLDVHGPNSADNAQIISTMFRDQYAFDAFAASGIPGVAPLLADDPRQIPFQNAEDQYEDRWVVEAQIQANQIVSSIPQQTFDVIAVDLINVDAAYPP